jgi:hypothetical protein
MAWTDRYVRADAAGGGDGTTDTNSGANGAWTLAEAITNEAAGLRINWRAGTIASTTTSRTFAQAGTTSSQIWWRGFNTTPGDLDAAPLTSRTPGTDMPHLTFSTGRAINNGAHKIFSGIAFTGSPTTNPVFSGVATTRLHRCRVENQSANSGANAVSTIGWGQECYFKSNAAADVLINLARTMLAGCVIDGGKEGIANVSSGSWVLGCLFLNQAANCIVAATQNNDFLLSRNLFYNPAGHGVSITAAYTNVGTILDNLFHTITGSGKAGIKNNDASAINTVSRFRNAFYNCTTPEDGFGDSPDFDRIIELSDPLEAVGSRDFRYKTTATGYQAGFPGLFEGLTFQSYSSPGAHIPAAAAGGGGRNRIIGA